MIKSMEEMIGEEKNGDKGEAFRKPIDDFECDICGKAFKTKYKFKRHRGIHEERKKYKCEVCGVILTGEGSYKKHSRRHCSQGKKQKQKQIDEDRPTFVMETVNEVCNICEKEFETKSQLKKHGEIHTDTKKYDCEVCGISHCNKHKNTGNESSDPQNVAGKRKPVIVCKVCGQIFSSMNSFRVHKKKHLGVRYYCTRCAQSFTTTDQLKLHERGHDDVRSFQCAQCDSQFKRKSNLTRHMAIHEGRKKFVCHICGKAFVLNESLAAHMKVHEDSPPLSCDICQATFKYENSLKTHQKLHSNLKEFKCTICNREFLRKRTLEDHLKCHEKGTNRVALLAKPSEFCTLCSKGFANAYGLKRHMKKHRLGILKHYNRSCGKNSANNMEDIPNAGKDVKKKKAPQRNQVVVYSNLVDDGNLFEKIDPNCFIEKQTNVVIVKSEYRSKQNEFVESDKICNKGTAMPSDNHKPTEDSEADLEDTDEGYSNEDEDYSLLNSMDKGLKSSLDIKANKQETPREMETEYQTELYFDHNHISTECDNPDEDVKFEDTSKGQDSNVDKVSAGNSDVIFDAQFITETTYIDKELDIENTIEHMAKDLIDEKGLAEIGSEGHKNDNEFVPFIDNNIKSKCISTDNFASAKDVDQVKGNTQEFDFEYGNYQEHDVKGIKESHIETAIFQRDAQKIVNSLNVDTMTGSEHLQLKVIEENQKGNHVNHHIDTHCFECMICKTGKLFKSIDSFKEHMKRDHDEICESYFECSNCPQKFYDKTEYEAHLRDENHDLTEASNIQCKFCMTSYSSLKSLQNHLRKYHKDNDGTIFRCDYCEKMFASKVLYRNHMDIHIIGKAKSRQLCECDICGSEHKSIVALRRHKRVTHSVEEDDVYMLSPQGNVTVEHENNTKNRGENLVREVIAQQEVCGVKDVKLTQEGDGRQNLQVLNCDGFNVANPGKKDQNISGYSTQSKSKESVCNHNGLEEGIIGRHVDMTHGRDENISVQDIDQYVTKQIEADKYRSNENDTDLRKDTINVHKRKSDQDFVSNSSTKERFQRKFQCIECDKSFHMMSTLKQHMLGHKKESDDVTKLYQCGQCAQRFIRKSQLMIHLHKFHSKFTYACNLCPRKFTSVFCLRTHKCVKLRQNKHTDKTKLNIKGRVTEGELMKFKCDICNEMFAKHCCLQVHIYLHSTSRYKCLVCKRAFTNRRFLKQHIIIKHGQLSDSAAGINSDTNFLSDKDLQSHVVASEEEMTFKCRVCSASLSSNGNLKRHMKLKHKSNEMFLNGEKCIECEELLRDLEKPKVRTKRTFPCNSCEQTFPSKLLLGKHLNDTHNVIFNYCKKCSKKFSSLSNLKRHELIQHSGEGKVQRNFMCNECGRCFTAKDSLRVHMFSHTGERPYRCNQCNATYSRSSHLLRHIKVKHENKLNNICNFEGCGKRFYEASTLRIHQRSHTDERPYQCPHCDQRFRTLNNRRTHLRTHVPVKQFECHICLQGLSTKHNLLQHLQRHEVAEKMNPGSVQYDPNFKSNKRVIVKKMEDKRFGCMHCPKMFTTSRGVYAHQRKACRGVRKERNVENDTRYYVLQSTL